MNICWCYFALTQRVFSTAYLAFYEEIGTPPAPFHGNSFLWGNQSLHNAAQAVLRWYLLCYIHPLRHFTTVGATNLSCETLPWTIYAASLCALNDYLNKPSEILSFRHHFGDTIQLRF